MPVDSFGNAPEPERIVYAWLAGALYYYIFVSSRAATICGAGWQPAADWQSVCRWHFLGSRRDACIVLRLAAMRGRLPSLQRIVNPPLVGQTILAAAGF